MRGFALRQKIDSYKDALSKTFKKLKECGSEVIFMTPNLMADDVSPEIFDEYTREVYENMIKTATLEEYIKAAKQLCIEENIPLCDCYEIWSALKKNKVNTTRLLANRINHPIEKMHWLFAFKLIEIIFKEED